MSAVRQNYTRVQTSAEQHLLVLERAIGPNQN